MHVAAPQLKKRQDIHLARKIWHFCGVIALAVLFHNLTRSNAIQFLIFFGTFFIFIDVARLMYEPLNKRAVAIMKPFMRDSERNNLAGVTYLIVGVFLLVLLFDSRIVTLSLLFLAFADPIASYFGIRYGKDKIFGRKSFQGTLAAFLTCLAIAAIYYYSKQLMTERLVIVSVLSALAGALAEAIPVAKLDDNLVMPVVSAILLQGIFFLFGGFVYV